MAPDNLNPSKEGKGIRWAPELLGRELKETESGRTAKHADGFPGFWASFHF